MSLIMTDNLDIDKVSNGYVIRGGYANGEYSKMIFHNWESLVNFLRDNELPGRPKSAETETAVAFPE